MGCGVRGDRHSSKDRPLFVSGCELEGVGEAGSEGVGREDEVSWADTTGCDGGGRVGCLAECGCGVREIQVAVTYI